LCGKKFRERKKTMSLNKVILIGNVGKDPDVRYFDSGSAIANFPMATSERGYTLANGTVVPERTEWHNIVVRREQLAFVEKWVKKGSGVYVEGKIRTRTYDDQAGVKRYVTEIHADRVEFFSFGGRSENSSAQTGSGQATPPQPQSPLTGATPVVTPPLPSAGTDGQGSNPPF
jgi:single-strand DNA-binding protein